MGAAFRCPGAAVGLRIAAVGLTERCACGFDLLGFNRKAAEAEIRVEKQRRPKFGAHGMLL
jgi:hypothetical protein